MKNLFVGCVLFALVAYGAPAAAGPTVPPKPLNPSSPGYPEDQTDTGLGGRAEVDATVKADGSVAADDETGSHHRAGWIRRRRRGGGGF